MHERISSSINRPQFTCKTDLKSDMQNLIIGGIRLQDESKPLHPQLKQCQSLSITLLCDWFHFWNPVQRRSVSLYRQDSVDSVLRATDSQSMTHFRASRKELYKCSGTIYLWQFHPW